MYFPFFLLIQTEKYRVTVSCLFVRLRHGQGEGWLLLYPMHLCVQYLYMLIFLCHCGCMFILLLSSWSRFMEASLLCKLFHLLLLWMCTHSDVPAASDLSRTLGSEAVNRFCTLKLIPRFVPWGCASQPATKHNISTKAGPFLRDPGPL